MYNPWFLPKGGKEIGLARPGTTTAGTASVQIVPGTVHRKKMVIVNISDTRVFLNKGTHATLNAGIPLNAEGGSMIDEPDTEGRIWKGAWSAITTAANKTLAWLEEA